MRKYLFSNRWSYAVLYSRIGRPTDRSHTWKSKSNETSDYAFVFCFNFVVAFLYCMQLKMHSILPVLALFVYLVFARQTFEFFSPEMELTKLRFTYVSIAVQCVVCQFDFIEANWLCLPMRAECWTVWMHVHALCTLWFGTTSRYPLAARKFVTTITERCHLKYNTVVCIFFQSGQSHAQWRKHAAGGKNETNTRTYVIIKINSIGAMIYLLLCMLASKLRDFVFVFVLLMCWFDMKLYITTNGGEIPLSIKWYPNILTIIIGGFIGLSFFSSVLSFQ